MTTMLAQIDAQLHALHVRAGSPPDLRRRDQAMTWLLQYAEDSFPVVLARIEAQPEDMALIDLIGRYRRVESTATLLHAFEYPRTRLIAASGLGMSPDPQARVALRLALNSPDLDIVTAALSGLAASGDPSVSMDITSKLKDEHAVVRWTAVEAASRLACLDRATLIAIASNDSDPDVRKLAAEKLQQ